MPKDSSSNQKKASGTSSMQRGCLSLADQTKQNPLELADPLNAYGNIGKPVVGISAGLATFGHVFQITAQSSIQKVTLKSEIDEPKISQVEIESREKVEPISVAKTESAIADAKNSSQGQAARRKLLRNLKSIEDMGHKSNLVTIDQGGLGMPS